jgi:hypothetical protein
MNKIIPPIHPQDHTPAVADLQKAMLFIVENRQLSPAGLSVDRWRQDLSPELGVFGTATTRLLAGLRSDLHLPNGGFVNEQTAEALNQQLADLGALQEDAEKEFVVDGKVVSRSSAGVGKLQIRIVDKNVGDPVPLAETATKEDGTYKATFTISDLQRRGKDLPDLQTHAFAGDKFLGASEARYNASNRETLNVVLTEEASTRLPSEHATLTGALSAHVRGSLRDLQETDNHQDITYLANKTGWDARAVAMAALADQFSQIHTDDATPAGIPSPLYYALFRAGLPSNPETLYQSNLGTIEGVWNQAIKQGVISADLQSQVASALQVFEKLKAQRMMTAPALLGVSSMKEMVTASGLTDPHQQHQFAQIYAANRADILTFWRAVGDAFGQRQAQRLQVDGKLCFLTVNNAPLIQALHNSAGANGVSDPLQLAQMGYHRTEKWNALLRPDIPIPAEVPGDTAQTRRANYAAYLAARVRLSYPTASIAELVNSGDLTVDIPTRVEAFLTQHQAKFVVGRQAVEQYVAQNKIQVDPEVVAQVERIHRVYQITPSDQAMVGLLKHGIDAAYDVIRYDKEVFVRTYADDLGGAEAAAYTYRRAQQVHNVVLNVAMSYLTARTGISIGEHSPAGQSVDSHPMGQQAATANDIIAYPTLEELFGSMDFCACEHCRSILSPAAYLVDLLLFLEGNPQNVLLGRRPDIQYLPLTCENTNTALPYIDLVNETLEYFVANITQPLSLTNYKGHDTGDVASEDLLASPQSFNDGVRVAAYSTLRGERFPITLPFHQPLESVRRYFNKFEVPLPVAMERLRKSDDLERGSNPYGWRDILMEEIGLSRDEHEILTDSPNAVPLWKTYGFPNGTQDPDVIAGFGNTFGLSNAKQFARRVGITYEDVVAILKTQFVNPNSDLVPKLERLGVSFAALAELKANNTDIDLPQGANAPDPADYDGDIKAWVKKPSNYTRIMRLIVLAVPLGTWTSKSYLLGDCVTPTKPEAGSSFYYACTKAGISAATEPNPWPTAPGNTCGDGMVVWTCRDGTTDCNFDDWAFRYADPGKISQNIQGEGVEFVRLLRFIRLWKKLGWSIEQTDAAICSLLPPPTPAQAFADTIDTVGKLNSGFLTLLPRLGIVVRVMRAINLTPKRDLLSLLACWAEIGTHGDRALYRQMFLNPAILVQDAVFADNGYGEFLQLVAVSYAHPQATLDPLISGAAQGKISYDNAERRLSYAGVLDAATRDALKAVPGVSQAFQNAVNALYSAQRLVSHSEALRSAFDQSSEEHSQILAALGFDGGFVKVGYKHSQPTLEQPILDAAPGIGYDDVKKELTYRGYLSNAIRDGLKSLKAVVATHPKFPAAVDALYAANQTALAPLTLANISAVFRRGWLARKLKVSVRELLLLMQLTSLDPFAPPDLSTPAILQIIALVQAFKDRGLKSAVPLYLIWNQDLSGKSAPDPAQVTEFARTLRGDFSSIDDQFAVAEDPGGAIERAQFAMVYGQEAAAAFFALLDDTLVLDVAYTHPPLPFEPSIKTIQNIDENIHYDDFRHRLSHIGLMTKAVSLMALTGATQEFEDAVQALSEKSLDAEGSFFTRYPELKPIYDKTVDLNSKTLGADYTQQTPTLDASITDADPRISYDNANHHLLYSGILTVANRDKLKAVPDVTEAFQAAVDELFARSEAAKEAVLATLRPELARRRKRQQTLQRLSAVAGIELSSTQTLLDPAAPPYPLDSVDRSGRSALSDFLSLETSGLAAKIFDSDKASGPPNASGLSVGIVDYSKSGGNSLPSNQAAGAAISGIWSGRVETSEAGYYNFIIETDAGASVTLSLDGADCPLIPNGKIWRNSKSFELKAGTLYQIELKVEKVKDALKLKWETPKRPREVIPSRYLYSPISLELCSDAYIRFLKAAALAAGFRMTAGELAHFATDPDYRINANGKMDSPNGQGWLNALPKADNLHLQNPVDAVIASTLNASLLIPLRALLDYARIKANISPGDESLLTALKDPATATRKPDSLLFALTGWNQNFLYDTLVHFGGTIDGLVRFYNLRRLYDALDIASQMGISASALIQAVTNEPDSVTVRDLQAALRARYDTADWRDVVQPINDELRSLQRDALVAYILHQMRISPDQNSQKIDTADKLFEYFLMDVQMEPGMQTSRVRHALSSVQLFIERCLMNLEAPAVSPASLDPNKQWEWMKRYRVWEANRKVFLWPENWLESELRDYQSPFFKDTMSELLQSDITEDSAVTALLNYLSKLEEVAKLEPCGMYYLEPNAQAKQDEVCHVVARTAGAHRKYYYRRYEDSSWTPWEQIKLDIEDNPVIPVVWKNQQGQRLLLFWLRILKDAGPQNVTGDPHLIQLKMSDVAGDPAVTVKAILCWSEYHNGSWQATKTSDINNPISLGPLDRSQLVLIVKEESPDESGGSNALRIEVTTGGHEATGPWFLLYNTHSLPLPNADTEAGPLATPEEQRFLFALDDGTFSITYHVGDPGLSPAHVGMEPNFQPPPVDFTVNVLKTNLTVSTIEPQHPLQNAWQAPFFLVDSRYVFYVATTRERSLLAEIGNEIGKYKGYLYNWSTSSKKSQKMPKIVYRKDSGSQNQRLSWGDGESSGLDPGVPDPERIQLFVSEDAYIRQGLGTSGIVTYRGKRIGPSGSVSTKRVGI